MIIKTACCLGDIVQGTTKEYPLGGNTWFQSFSVDVCDECGKEAEPVECCDSCGDGGVTLKSTPMGDWCSPCVNVEVETRIRQIKQEWGLGA